MASDLDIAALTNERGFRLTGDLDFSTVPRFAEALRTFPPGDELNLDLADVIHIDSAGLHAILGFARSRGNGSLVLLNPTSIVLRSFEIAGIDQHPAIEIGNADKPEASRQARGGRAHLRRTG
jgi:anti-anti-sigma factor